VHLHRMHHADHAHPGKPHVSVDGKILTFPDLVKYDIIRPDKQEGLCSVHHAAFKRRVLGDVVGHLKVAWCFHRLDNEVMVGQKCGEALSKGCLSSARGSCDQDARRSPRIRCLISGAIA